MIIDAFTYFNEVDLLEIRLNELRGVVDLFVLVEASRTFTGRPKPLHYSQNDRERFRDFPIRHVAVTDMPHIGTAWDREAWQRNAILRGLEDVPDDAVVLMSDVDEIPSVISVPAAVGPSDLVMFDQQFFYYTMNQRIRGTWHGTRAAQVASLRKWSPQWARTRGNSRIAAGGWHFSYMGGVDAIAAKLNAFSHQEYNTPEINNAAHISQAIEQGVDLFGRNGLHKIEVVSGVDHLPAYVQANQKKFAHLLRS